MTSSGEQQVMGRLADNIRLERVLRRESQEALAFRANIHRTQISLIESGQRSMQIMTFVKLCGALGLSPNELLKGVSWEPGRFNKGSFQIADDEVWKKS